MARAKQAPDVEQCGDPYEWAAQTLRLRLDEVLGFRDAALDAEQVAGIHDMRVATRRLRSAMRDFVLIIDKKPLRRVKKDVKRLADSLGRVRDQDVEIKALSKSAVGADNESVRRGIAELTVDHRALRERAHVRLKKTFEAISLDDLRERFSAGIDHALSQQDLFGPASLKEVGRDVIEDRLQDLVELGRSIYTPFDSRRIHKLRIAEKRLRYAIELFAACWSEEITGFATQLAKLQSYLGDIHDCDVWMADLSKRLRQPGRNTRLHRRQRHGSYPVL